MPFQNRPRVRAESNQLASRVTFSSSIDQRNSGLCRGRSLDAIAKIAAGFALGMVAPDLPMSTTKTSVCSRSFAPTRTRCFHANGAEAARRSNEPPARLSSARDSWPCSPTLGSEPSALPEGGTSLAEGIVKRAARADLGCGARYRLGTVRIASAGVGRAMPASPPRVRCSPSFRNARNWLSTVAYVWPRRSCSDRPRPRLIRPR